jgi:hypothetical protein
VNEKGRRYLVEVPEEQIGIRRICELYDADVYLREICKLLNIDGIPSRAPKWHKFSLYRVLKHAGYEDPERPRKSSLSRKEMHTAGRKFVNRDKTAAAARAAELRAQGLSLRQIGERLLGEGLLPPRSEAWHAAGIRDLLLEIDRVK